MDKKITADTIIVDALDINPNAGEILMVHGADLDKMLEELNNI